MTNITTNISIKNPETYRHALVKAPEILIEEMVTATEEAEFLLVREVQDRTPVGANGTLRQSIIGETPIVHPLGVSGMIGSAMEYVVPVELGTKPHSISLEGMTALTAWVKARIPEAKNEEQAKNIAERIKWKIKRYGTQGKFMFTNSLRDLEPQLEAIYDRGMDRVEARINQL